MKNKSIIHIKEELLKCVGGVVNETTLFHLALAISVDANNYITEDTVLLKHKKNIEKKFNIHITTVEDVYSMSTGVII